MTDISQTGSIADLANSARLDAERRARITHRGCLNEDESSPLDGALERQRSLLITLGYFRLNPLDLVLQIHCS